LQDNLISINSDNGAVRPSLGRDANGPRLEPADPFDPSRLRLSQDFAATIGVKKALVTVPVRKPDRQSFVQVHPDPAYRLETVVLELKEERETYLVEPGLWSELPNEVVPKLIVTAINRQGVVFLWPVRLPGPDGRIDDWNRSALEAVARATSRWVRVAANMGLGAYGIYEAPTDLAPPTWPDVSFRDLLQVAFKDRLISTVDHPVLRRLRGEA
jgi:hypothetical protein